MAELAVAAHHGSGDDDVQAFVAVVLRDHTTALLRTARLNSLCVEDAEDAFQRAMEIFVRRAATLEHETVEGWLHTIVTHEAWAIRRLRRDSVDAEEVDLDEVESVALPSDDEQVLRFDRTRRSAEALARLKPAEVQALWLRAQGHTYGEIAATTGWSYTKVNRLVSEGRRTFLKRYAGIESGAECERWAPLLSKLVDGEAKAREVVAVRPHLRHCPACRASVRELRLAGPRLAGALPVLGLAGGGRDLSGGGLLGRAWEWLSGGVQERVLGPVLKLQSAAETASTAKVAAVAASAAAIAGGGALGAREAGVLPGRAPAHHAHAHVRVATTVARPAATATPAPSMGAPATVRPSAAPSPTPHRSAPAHHHRAASRAASKSGGDEFAVEPAPAVEPPAGPAPEPIAVTSAAPAAAPAAKPATSTPGDFGVEGR